MTKVREVIEIAGWVNGSGYSYNTVYSDQIVEVLWDTAEEIKDNFDWSWWEKSENNPNADDLEITVIYYPADTEDIEDADAIAVFKIWESEIED